MYIYSTILCPVQSGAAPVQCRQDLHCWSWCSRLVITKIYKEDTHILNDEMIYMGSGCTLSFNRLIFLEKVCSMFVMLYSCCMLCMYALTCRVRFCFDVFDVTYLCTSHPGLVFSCVSLRTNWKTTDQILIYLAVNVLWLLNFSDILPWPLNFRTIFVSLA